jgi:hypothetical protein
VYLRRFENTAAISVPKIIAFKRFFSTSADAGKVLLMNLYKKYPSILELIDSVALISIIILLCSALGLFDWWCHIIDQMF